MPESSGSWNCKSEAGVTCDPDGFNRIALLSCRLPALNGWTSRLVFDSTSPRAAASLKRTGAEYCFILGINFEPGRPLAILPAAF